MGPVTVTRRGLSLTRLSRSSPGLIPPLVTLAAQREGREPTGRTRSESGREVSDRHAERRGGEPDGTRSETDGDPTLREKRPDPSYPAHPLLTPFVSLRSPEACRERSERHPTEAFGRRGGRERRERRGDERLDQDMRKDDERQRSEEAASHLAGPARLSVDVVGSSSPYVPEAPTEEGRRERVRNERVTDGPTREVGTVVTRRRDKGPPEAHSRSHGPVPSQGGEGPV